MQKDKKEQLFQLLKGSNQSLSCSYLATKLNVTERSIRNYVKAINQRAHTALILSDSQGYYLNDHTLRYTDLMQPIHLEYTQQQRCKLILKELLFHDQFYYVKFAQMLYISEITVQNDLNKCVRPFLSSYAIYLKKQGNRYILKGKESEKRNLLSNLIKEELKDFSYFYFDELNHKYDYTNVKPEIESILLRHQLNVNSYTLQNIATHLIVSISRLEHHCYIKEESTLTPTFYRDIEPVTKDIATFLKVKYHVEFPPTEMDYISFLLSSKTYQKIPAEVDEKDLHQYIEEQYIQICKEIVKKLNTYYHIEFDHASFIRFAFHIKALANRSSLNQYISNPHTKITRAMNPFLFEIGVFICDILKAYDIRLNDDEIAFLAFHIGAFYDTSNDKKKVLQVLVQLPDYLNSIRRFQEKTQSLSAFVDFIYGEALKQKSSEYDLIVAVDQIDTTIPIFYISPMITEFELASLKDLIYEVFKRKNNPMFSNDEIPIGLFKKNVSGITDYKQLIKSLVEELAQLHYVDDAFYQDVIEREKLSSTAFVEGIALPHSLQMNAHQNCFSIVINDTAINWNGSEVYVVILIAFSNENRLMFRDFVDSLINKLYESQDNILSMQMINSYEEFIQWIKNET